MSECLLITNGNSVLENTNSSVPVVSNVKEPLPDSSTCNDSECASTTVHLTTSMEQNGDVVEMGNCKKATDDLDNKTEKLVKKDAVEVGHIADPIMIENENQPKDVYGSDSLPKVTTKEAIQRVKKKLKRVGKTHVRAVRNAPQRTINGTHPSYAPVRRHKRVVEKPESTHLNGINELNGCVDDKETNNEGSLNEECVTTETKLYNALPDPSSPVVAKSKQGDKKIPVTQFEICERQCDNEQNLEGAANSTVENAETQTISLSSIKKGNSNKKIGLSHFQIMRKVLNKKALYGALLVDQMFECPICHVRKQKAQYLLLHLKGHNDLTLVFERFQAYGEPIEEIEEGAPDLSKQIGSQNVILPKTENPRVEKVVLRKKRSKAIINEFGIPIFPLSEPKLRKKKTINGTDSDGQSNPIKIEVALPSITSEMPIVEPLVDPELKPSPSRQPRKRKIPVKRISKRSPTTETYEEPPDDVIVDAKKSRLGISHTRALDPELLDNLKQVMRNKVTEVNPHQCKFCGKMFVKGQGLYAHYFKHSRSMVPPAHKTEGIPENGPPQHLENGDSAFDALIPVKDKKDTERNRDTDFLTLQELETNVNRLLRSLVKDTDVLRNLGWPERRVSDLVIDILERCSLQPAYCGMSRLSQLQCLRKNMGKLFRFCIKEEAMKRYGWDIKLVDIVVREMMATEECLNLSRL